MTPGEATPTVVEIEALRKSFGDLEVLRGIDLRVERGEVVCVIGPSGSGKSTLLRCVNLLEEPTSGDVVVDGVRLTDPDVDIDAARRTIGMVFQSFNLFPHLTVTENVTIAQRRVLRRGKAEAERVAKATLERVGLAEKADSFPAQLSGGPCSTTTPPSMKTTRSATSRANAISWVTTIMVMPSSASCRMTVRTSPTSSGSSAEVGSSKSISSGLIARARAMATRCC